jgi:hypothetical protein
MKKLLLIGLFLGGLVVGVIVGGWWSWHVFSRLNVSKQVDAASIAAFQAEWLAQLRLNETQSTIKDIENCMDIQVATLAQWNEVSPPDEKTRKARNRWLVPVKVYHESYPVSGDNAVQINAFLSKIPGRKTNSACKNGICRLDDLRLAKQQTVTNSP